MPLPTPMKQPGRLWPVVALAMVGSALAAEPRAGWRMDFNALASGPLATERLKEHSPVPVLWAGGLAKGGEAGRFRIVESAGHGRALEVLYPRGGVGPQQTGGQWLAQLPPRDSYELEYRVRFDARFDWRRGGKLPGLAGGSVPVGGNFDPDGFSSRYMWRDNGQLVVYLYWAGQASAARERGRQYGVDLACGVTLERGRDYRLRQRVTLNTPGQADGVLEVWVDGRPVLKRTDLLFRDAPAKRWQIDRFFFSTFHGGNDPTWAPKHDCTVEFDDFVVLP
jgi:hypothetical protein